MCDRCTGGKHNLNKNEKCPTYCLVSCWYIFFFHLGYEQTSQLIHIYSIYTHIFFILSFLLYLITWVAMCVSFGVSLTNLPNICGPLIG